MELQMVWKHFTFAKYFFRNLGQPSAQSPTKITITSITRFTEHEYYLHFVLLFWNHVLTCASVILSVLAKEALSAEARYFCLWNLFSSSQICIRVKLVRGFFLFGGVRFWYGWPMRRGGIGGRPVDKEKGTVREKKWNLFKFWHANNEMNKITVKLAIH